MDITPLVPETAQVITAYGEGGFKVSGTRWDGSVLIFPDKTQAWPVAAGADIDLDALRPFEGLENPPEILLIGCGERMVLIPSAVRRTVRTWGPVIEPMDTGAACRTYNVLMSEGRKVAAALVAI